MKSGYGAGLLPQVRSYIIGDQRSAIQYGKLSISSYEGAVIVANGALETAQNLEKHLTDPASKWAAGALARNKTRLQNLEGYAARHEAVVAALRAKIADLKGTAKILLPLIFASFAWLGYKNITKNNEQA